MGFTGGEPFLAIDFLCSLAKSALEEGMLFDRIMTNAVWYRDEADLKETLTRLYKAGYDGEICVSVDAFHRQDLKKVARFIRLASSIWNRKDLVTIAYTAGAADNITKARVESLKDSSLFIRSFRIKLSPVGKAKALKDPWDGRWFKEDYCKGPGNVFFVMPNGSVKPCCGYANGRKELTVGNIRRDSAKKILKSTLKNRFVSAVFCSGLSRIRDRLERLGIKFPGKTSDHCYFCNFILTEVPRNILKKCLAGVIILLLIATSAFAETRVLKLSKDYKKVNARVIKHIKLPKWYHEGLYLNGRDMWISNGNKGKIWVVDILSGSVKSEIMPIGSFTEAVTGMPGGGYFVTDWDAKKLYRADLDNNKLIARSEVSLAPAHPAGAIWTGSRLFVVTWKRGLGTKFNILEMDEDANIINKIMVRRMQEPAHLAWDGKSLWVTSWFNSLVYEIDVNKWEIIRSFRSPAPKATGIAWDGKSLWITGTYADLYQVEVAVNVMGGEAVMELKVTSSSFKEGGMMPKSYAGDGDNMSPPLNWSAAPQGTKSFAIISDDPDAPRGDWVHWVVFNIPASATSLKEGIPQEKLLADGSRQGINDSGKIGYDGPCPPSGVHRYYFKVHALDTMLDLKSGASKEELLKAMDGHILAKGHVMGRYKR